MGVELAVVAFQPSGLQSLRFGKVDDNVNVHCIHVAADMPTHYTITELAREFDVTPRAIRFYEDQGLLSPSREGASGLRRVFSARDRTRLKLTLRGKRLGFTLSEIRALLDLYEAPIDTVAQLQAFLTTLTEHRQVLERQFEDLNATLEDLAQYEAQARALLESSQRHDMATEPQQKTLN